MSIFRVFQAAMEVWACIIGLIVVIYVSRFVYQDKKIKELWIQMIDTNLLLVFDAVTFVLHGSKLREGFVILQISTFAVLLLQNYINWRYAVNINQMIHPSNKFQWNGYLIATAICLSLCVIGLFSNPWTGVYYHFNAAGEYVRGPLLMFSFLFPLLSMVICGINIARHYGSFPRRIGRTFIVSMFIIIVCIVIQFFMEGYAIINLAIDMDILLLLIETSINQYERRMRKFEVACSYFDDEISEEIE